MENLTRIAAAAVLLVASAAEGGWSPRATCCAPAPTCCAPQPCVVRCAPVCTPTCHDVEVTVMAPQWTTETRRIQVCELQTRVCERQCTVYDRVPEVRKVSREVTVYRAIPQTREETYTACEPRWREVVETCTVMVPQREKRQGVRKVVTCVPVKRTYTVCEDQGHWEDRTVAACAPQPCATACGSCNACCNPCPPVTCTRRVWVPNIVEREVEYTAYERRVEEAPCEYDVIVCKPQEREVTRRVCEMVPVQRTRTVHYTVCKPETRVCEYDVTTYRTVPRQVTKRYTVCVPVMVEREVQVPVCRMTPRKVVRKQCTTCGTAPAPCHHCLTRGTVKAPMAISQAADFRLHRGTLEDRIARVTGPHHR